MYGRGVSIANASCKLALQPGAINLLTSTPQSQSSATKTVHPYRPADWLCQSAGPCAHWVQARAWAQNPQTL